MELDLMSALSTVTRAIAKKIPNGLSVVDNKLYLSRNNELISEGVDMPEGGGGGSNASITLKNLLDTNILTVAVGGNVDLNFSFISVC